MAEEQLSTPLPCTKKECIPPTFEYVVCGENVMVKDSNGNKAVYSQPEFDKIFDIS